MLLPRMFHTTTCFSWLLGEHDVERQSSLSQMMKQLNIGYTNTAEGYITVTWAGVTDALFLCLKINSGITINIDPSSVSEQRSAPSHVDGTVQCSETRVTCGLATEN